MEPCSASTLEHLASEDHLNQARVFWKEHGVNPKVLDVDAVVVSGPELYRVRFKLNVRCSKYVRRTISCKLFALEVFIQTHHPHCTP